MKLNVYSVYDSKAQAYLTPFYMRADGEAVRACVEAAMDVKHNFSRYGADYTLFKIAEFDDGSGRIEPLDVFTNLGNILSLTTALGRSNSEVSNG